MATCDDDDGAAKLWAAEPDVLLVSVPTGDAARWTRAGLARGLHVFCEKPPARSPAELAEVLGEAERRPHQVLMYGFNHRWHGSVQEARRRIDAGELGVVSGLRGVYGKRGIEGWRADPERAGGGILLDQGIHLADLMLAIAGDFPEVSARVFTDRLGLLVEDGAQALLRSSAGVAATLWSSAAEPAPIFRLEVVLTKGRLVLDGILSGSMAYAPERLLVEPRSGPAEVLEWSEDTCWRDELVELESAIRQGRAPRQGTPAQAQAALDLVHRIYVAAGAR